MNTMPAIAVQVFTMTKFEVGYDFLVLLEDSRVLHSDKSGAGTNNLSI